MNKKRIVALVAIVVVIALMLGVYLATRPETQQGSKAITVQVAHKDGTEKTFTYRTDAEFLAEVLAVFLIKQRILDKLQNYRV